MHHKQASAFLVATFIVLGILGSMAAVAIPHAADMVYQSEALQRETEFFKVRSAVDEMLQESSCGKLVSIGPVAELSSVCTADAEPLFLTDYLPEEIRGHLAEDCMYSFTSNGFVLQTTY